LKTDAQSQALLGAYEQHIARMLGFLGEAPEQAAAQAKQVVGFETELAKIALPRADLRDPDATYNLLGVTGLQATDPVTPWKLYFEALGYAKIGGDLNVATPTYFKQLGAVVRKADVPTLQAYLRWHILRVAAPAPEQGDRRRRLQASPRSSTGAKELSPRWERCVNLANFGLGELVGQAFVKERFAGASKAVALDMIGHIEVAFEAGLPSLAWMDPSTRTRAVEKMKALRNKIGYPDRWRDYGKLKLSRKDHLGNVIAGRRFLFAHEADRISKVGRQGRVADAARDRQRLLQPLGQRDGVPGRHPAAALLQRRLPDGDELRRHRHGDGPRADPRLRRPGPQVRRPGVLREWWEPSASAEVRRSGPSASRPCTAASRCCPGSSSTAS
jgi:putative endopeptidase